MSVKERPVVFTGPMVRAILEGRKTVTRRPIKPRLTNRFDEPRGQADVDAGYPFVECEDGYVSAINFCPYGKPGDRLWVRETFAVYGDQKMHAIHYRADRPHHVGQRGMGYKSSTQMPRWASRILLEVTSIRVERLQDRTDGSLWAEGFATFGDGESDWDSRYEAQGHGVSANPWTWVVEFKRVTR